MEYFNAFWVGGLLCAIGQILIDKTKLTPARILVIYVCAGAVLTAIGLYDPIVKYAGTGATIPISGFGYSLAKGVMEAVDKEGFIGIFTGGITATAAGIAAAVTFGLIFAILGKPKEK
ncbi:MAG: stage V sporulation protein AE [Clostridia bacterium]|nr:stage V sporulation protein AE [Clostridia bacterium]